MELMQANSTDKRLDDLNHKVDRGFERVDVDLRAQRTESRTEFMALRSEMKAGFERVDERFEALHRLLIQVGCVLTTALIGLIATQF